jgi:hypothetical protein
LKEVDGSSNLPSNEADGESQPVELSLIGTLWRAGPEVDGPPRMR